MDDMLPGPKARVPAKLSGLYIVPPAELPVHTIAFANVLGVALIPSMPVGVSGNKNSPLNVDRAAASTGFSILSIP